MPPDKAAQVSAYYVYMARCADGSLYTGYCVDLGVREAKHNSGKASKYTRSRRPVKFVYHEVFATRSEACRREAEIKKWPKGKKEKLIPQQ